MDFFITELYNAQDEYIGKWLVYHDPITDTYSPAYLVEDDQED